MKINNVLSLPAKVLLLTSLLSGGASATSLIQVQRKSSRQNVQLSKSGKKHWNTFFSNFSEAYVPAFREGHLTDEILIDFAVYHNIQNNFNNLHFGSDGKLLLSASRAQATVKKYFGLIIRTPQSTREVQYRSGRYEISEGIGEGITFSQIKRLSLLGGQRYIADVNVYFASSSWVGDPQRDPATWRKTVDSGPPVLDLKMQAMVQKVTVGKSSRYILVEYKQIWRSH